MSDIPIHPACAKCEHSATAFNPYIAVISSLTVRLESVEITMRGLEREVNQLRVENARLIEEVGGIAPYRRHSDFGKLK